MYKSICSSLEEFHFLSTFTHGCLLLVCLFIPPTDFEYFCHESGIILDTRLKKRFCSLSLTDGKKMLTKMKMVIQFDSSHLHQMDIIR